MPVGIFVINGPIETCCFPETPVCNKPPVDTRDLTAAGSSSLLQKQSASAVADRSCGGGQANGAGGAGFANLIRHVIF
ncbi:MAG TPA: hypothetical protein VGI75_03665 [Pirellulales bacterium]